MDQFSGSSSAEYYNHLAKVVRGPLWSPGRWQEIWRFQTGHYTELIDIYRSNSNLH